MSQNIVACGPAVVASAKLTLGENEALPCITQISIYISLKPYVGVCLIFNKVAGARNFGGILHGPVMNRTRSLSSPYLSRRKRRHIIVENVLI